MDIAVVREDLRFTDEVLNGLAEFFQAAKIRRYTGITFYQYLLCPEYFDSQLIELNGGNCNATH